MRPKELKNQHHSGKFARLGWELRTEPLMLTRGTHSGVGEASDSPDWVRDHRGWQSGSWAVRGLKG